MTETVEIIGVDATRPPFLYLVERADPSAQVVCHDDRSYSEQSSDGPYELGEHRVVLRPGKKDGPPIMYIEVVP